MSSVEWPTSARGCSTGPMRAGRPLSPPCRHCLRPPARRPPPHLCFLHNRASDWPAGSPAGAAPPPRPGPAPRRPPPSEAARRSDLSPVARDSGPPRSMSPPNGAVPAICCVRALLHSTAQGAGCCWCRAPQRMLCEVLSQELTAAWT